MGFEFSIFRDWWSIIDYYQITGAHNFKISNQPGSSQQIVRQLQPLFIFTPTIMSLESALCRMLHIRFIDSRMLVLVDARANMKLEGCYPEPCQQLEIKNGAIRLVRSSTTQEKRPMQQAHWEHDDYKIPLGAISLSRWQHDPSSSSNTTPIHSDSWRNAALDCSERWRGSRSSINSGGGSTSTIRTNSSYGCSRLFSLSGIPKRYIAYSGWLRLHVNTNVINNHTCSSYYKPFLHGHKLELPDDGAILLSFEALSS